MFSEVSPVYNSQAVQLYGGSCPCCGHQSTREPWDDMDDYYGAGFRRKHRMRKIKRKHSKKKRR